LSEAELLSRLLQAASRLKIIVTSREVLRLEEEWVYVVEGMEVPTPGDERPLSSFGAVQLFIERAQRVRSDLTLEQDLSCIAQICRLVQGIPLGIELAASRLRQQSCEEIASALTRNSDYLVTAFRNVPERHRSMRAVFSWSWSLLSEAEQLAFMKLSIFRGGCTQEAAAFVTESSLTTLVALVDKSLLRLYSNRRYDIHEILRQYAYEKLLDHRLVKQAKNVHLDYYSTFTRSLMAQSTTDLAWRSRLKEDYDNIRAAFEWCLLGEGDPETGLQLAITTFHFWRNGIYLGEGLKYISQLLNKLPKSEALQLRAKASARAAWLAVVLGDLTQAENFARTSLDIDPAQNDLWTKALALNVLGTVMRSYADYSNARDLYEEALQTSEMVGDLWLIALSVGNDGVLAFHQGNQQEAIQRFEQVLPLFQALNDHIYIAFMKNLLGRLLRQIGEFGRALELCQSEMFTAIDSQDQWAIALCVSGLAGLCSTVEWYDGTARLLGIEANLRASLGAALSPSVIPDHEAIIADVREHLDPASWNAFWASGNALTLEQAMPVILDSLDVLAVRLDAHEQKFRPENVQLSETLTPRELEILRLMADGLSNREIAEKYVVAMGTIAAHTHRIFAKLDVRNRTLAVTKARQINLL
jgi:predicted ATPase/DNA-binding CsgD family transcriptional regulator